MSVASPTYSCHLRPVALRCGRRPWVLVGAAGGGHICKNIKFM